MEGTRKGLRQLFIPISLEILCYMLAGMVDTLMLSSVNDEAVGAVGTANTYIGMFIIMFSIISSGMIAVMTQYIGAGRVGIAYQARQLGLMFNAACGVLLSVFLFFFSGEVLELVGVAPLLMEYAKVYLKIVGGCCFLNALIQIFSGYLRVFGHTRAPLAATLSANVVNVVLNAVFLFGLNMGVKGVAIATVLSHLMNLTIVIATSRYLIDARKDPERIKNTYVLGKIVKIGLPSACETALYNAAMALVTRFLNQMDAEGVNVTARAYAMQITNFSYCAGAALAQANAIMTGWRIGSKEYDECDKGTKKAAMIGIAVAAVIGSMLALSSRLLMRIFTDDIEMITLVGRILVIDIALEMGRVANMVFGNALKISGDAVFPTIIAAVFMYLCAVGGTWFFGIHLGLMVVGAYIGMVMDECFRAICVFLRWQSGRWRGKGIVGD